jgi:hypothetical protein
MPRPLVFLLILGGDLLIWVVLIAAIRRFF